MTQVNPAQNMSDPIALRSRATARTLAQRRADFQAQMRDMALSDLSALAARLDQLHKRLNRQEGREWTQLEVAEAAGVRYRTYQTWAGGHNENRDGKGYEAVARFYRRKLKDPSITRNWIVFGEQDAPPVVTPGDPEPIVLTAEDQERLRRVEEMLEELLRRTATPEPARPESEPGGDDDFPTDLPDAPDSPPAPPSEGEEDSAAAG